MTTNSAAGAATPRVTKVNGGMVRQLRELRGLGCAELADLVGVHRGYLNTIETGLLHGSPRTRYRIAQELDVELAEITYTVPRQRRGRPTT
jgi:transcriptional regulator with XRE-family HTH domain